MLFPRVGRKRPGLRIAWWGLVAFLCLGIFIHLVPIYFMLITSFKSGNEVLAFPPTWWPQEPTLAAWRLVTSVFSSGPMAALLTEPLYVYFRNSLLIAAGSLILGVPITALAAYANSKLQRGRSARLFFFFFIGTLMLPSALTLIPMFLLTRNWPVALPDVPNIPGTETAIPTVQIWDSLWAVVLPGVFSAFNFLLFKGYFDTIPDSVIQAARVDGGSEFNIFRRIVLPMSVPAFAVAIWTSFTGVWDQFLWPLVVLQSPENQPASVALYQLMEKFTRSGATNAQQAGFQSQQLQDILSAGLSWNGLMVLAILQTLPIFIAFIICREYLLRGIRIRGLK